MKKVLPLAALILSLALAGLTVWDMAAQRLPVIALADDPVTADGGTLSGEERLLFHDILTAVETGEDTVACPPVSDALHGKLLTHLGLYYGSMEQVSRLLRREDGYLALDLDLFRALEARKTVIDARIDEACASLRPGPDWYILWQICNYIAGRVTYDPDYRDTLDGLNGKGVCATYAMLFYKMATRLGYQTYICYGYANGGYHSWNMVELDGRQVFFDVTWYDNIVHDCWYIFHPTSWGRDYVLNNKFEGAGL